MQYLFSGILTLLTFQFAECLAKDEHIPPCNNESLAEAWGLDEEVEDQDQ